MSLTKSDILKADDLKMEEVEIPEWNGSVFVTELTGDARDEFEQYLAQLEEKRQEGNFMHLRAALAAATIVDEKKERMFTFNEIKQLGKKNGKALDRIFEAANKLNKVFGTERESVEKN